MGLGITLFVVVLIAVAFFSGKRYGQALESAAYAELAKIKASLSATGVRFETYLSGDLAVIHAEAAKVLNLPKTLGTFIKDEIKGAANKL